MKKLALYIFSVLLIIFALDVGLGFFVRHYLKHNKLPGDYESIDYLIHESSEDMVIIGNSLALNDINPNLIADSLNITCFNGGANSQLFPYFETMLDCMLMRERHPKYILLALRPCELGGTGIGDRYNILIPYYHCGFDYLDKNLESVRPLEKCLLQSNLYRYNTIWWRILLYHFISSGISGENGFTGKPIPSIFPKTIEVETSPITDERTKSFTSFIQNCKKNSIKVMIFFPHVLNKKLDGEPTIGFVEDYCKAHNIPVFDDSDNPQFLLDEKLFYDNSHLNIKGSEEYTNYIIPKIRHILSISNQP